MTFTYFSQLLIDQFFGGGFSFSTASMIPYKTSKMPLEQYGSNEVIVLIAFLVLAVIVYFYLKNKNPSQFKMVKDRKIQVIERTRVTARSSILLIQYNDRSFLMSQSADALTLITEVETENK